MSEEIGNPNWSISWHPGQIVNKLNGAKNITLKILVAEGYLTKEQAAEFDKKYTFTVFMQKWWNRATEKFISADLESSRYLGWEMVKVIPTKSLHEATSNLDDKSRFEGLTDE